MLLIAATVRWAEQIMTKISSITFQVLGYGGLSTDSHSSASVLAGQVSRRSWKRLHFLYWCARLDDYEHRYRFPDMQLRWC